MSLTAEVPAAVAVGKAQVDSCNNLLYALTVVCRTEIATTRCNMNVVEPRSKRAHSWRLGINGTAEVGQADRPAQPATLHEK